MKLIAHKAGGASYARPAAKTYDPYRAAYLKQLMSSTENPGSRDAEIILECQEVSPGVFETFASNRQQAAPGLFVDLMA